MSILNAARRPIRAGRASQAHAWVALSLLILSACTSQPPRSVPVETRPPPVVLVPEPERSYSSVVQRLIDEAEGHLRAGRIDQALASAERGLRIDRRIPEFYLVLARSHQRSANLEQARQFAQQGLRYANDESSDVAEQLRYLLVELE